MSVPGGGICRHQFWLPGWGFQSCPGEEMAISQADEERADDQRENHESTCDFSREKPCVILLIDNIVTPKA